MTKLRAVQNLFLLLLQHLHDPSEGFRLSLVSTAGAKNTGEYGITGGGCETLEDLPLTDASPCLGGAPKQAHYIKAIKQNHTNSVAVALGNMCFGGYFYNLDRGVSCGRAVASAGFDYYTTRLQDAYACADADTLDCGSFEAPVRALVDGGTTVINTNWDLSDTENSSWWSGSVAKWHVKTFADGTKVAFVDAFEDYLYHSFGHSPHSSQQRIKRIAPWLASTYQSLLPAAIMPPYSIGDSGISRNDFFALPMIKVLLEELTARDDVKSYGYEAFAKTDPINQALSDITKAHPDCTIFVAFTDLQRMAGPSEDSDLSYNSEALFAERYPAFDVIVRPNYEKRSSKGDDNYFSSLSTIEHGYGKRVAVVFSGNLRNAGLSWTLIDFDRDGEVNSIVDERKMILDESYRDWDPDTLTLVNKRGALAIAKFNEKILESKIAINGERGGYPDCDAIGGCRRNDCPAGRLVTSMMLDFCERASVACDISINNGGSIRESLPQGSITLGDVGNVLPFNNNVQIARMQGVLIRRLLQKAATEYIQYNVSDLGNCKLSGSFVHGAGLRYAINPVLKTVMSANVFHEGSWYDLDDDRFYNVVSNTYIIRRMDVDNNREVLKTGVSHWKDELARYLTRFEELNNGLVLNPGTAYDSLRLYNQSTLTKMGCSNLAGNPFTASPLPLRSQPCAVLVSPVSDYVAPPFSIEVVFYRDAVLMGPEEASNMAKEINVIFAFNDTEFCAWPHCGSGRDSKSVPDAAFLESTTWGIDLTNLSAPGTIPLVSVSLFPLPSGNMHLPTLPGSTQYANGLSTFIRSVWGANTKVAIIRENMNVDVFTAVEDAFVGSIGSARVAYRARISESYEVGTSGKGVHVMVILAQDVASVCRSLEGSHKDYAWITFALPDAPLVSDAACSGLLTLQSPIGIVKGKNTATAAFAQAARDIVVDNPRKLTSATLFDAMNEQFGDVVRLSIFNNQGGEAFFISEMNHSASGDGGLLQVDLRSVIWPSGSSDIPGTKKTESEGEVEEVIKTTLVSLGASCGAVILGSLLFVSYRHYKAHVIRKATYEQQQNNNLQQAITCTNTLEYPINLVCGSHFVSMGSLEVHERLRDSGNLIVLDSLGALSKLKSKGNKIVFISHQWTAFSEPDSNGVQYELMVKSLLEITKKRNWHMEDVLVWVDYCAIPQAHPGIQTLAIRALTVYASSANCLISVAPRVNHADLLNVICDKFSYEKRMWCRAEQVCFALSNGIENMYVATENGLEKADDNTFARALHVFDGETTCCRRQHANQSECDRQSLVVPILGLYGELICLSKTNTVAKRFLDAITEDKDSIFPRDFVFKKLNKRPVKVELFGDLIEAMEKRVSEDPFAFENPLHAVKTNPRSLSPEVLFSDLHSSARGRHIGEPKVSVELMPGESAGVARV